MENEADNNQVKSIDMENMKISKLAWKISLPMIISMISIALYGIIDTIFVSKTGKNALTAIVLVYPIQNIITAIALGLGTGINSLLSRTRGEKNNEKCKKIVVNGIKLTFLSWIITAIISYIISNKIFYFFTNNKEIVDLGSIYFRIIGVFSIGTFFQITTERILESYGKTKDSMLIQISGAVINLILDPILIFGINGSRGLGIKGAAIATIIGQCTGMIYGTYLIIRKYNMIKTKHILEIKFDNIIIKEIYKVGFPTTLLEIATSMITFILNKILISINNYAVDVWGIYGRIQKFVLITIYGLNYGMIPIVGYNIGAKKINRVKETIKYFLKASIIITLVGTLIFIVFPKTLLGWFTNSDETIKLGIKAFRILAFGLVFGGISLVISATFQSFGEGNYSLIVNLCRKIFISLPIIYIFKGIFGVTVVWYATVIAEIIATIVAIILIKKIFNKYELDNKF